MPFVLRLIAIFSFLGLCFAGVIFPFMKFSINGKEVTYSEFWSSGSGIQAYTLGISLFISGIGIYMKKEWSRSLLLIVFITFYLLIPAVQNGLESLINNLPVSLIYLVPLIWYLYFKQSVKDYYSV